MADLAGERIDRYQILEKIGEGGMATVYKARDTRLERDVALKLIRRSAFPAEMLDQILKRFEREAKSLARLSHPNIVTVHDYGEYDGAPYLVLELCPGGDLRQRLHGKPMDWREAIPLILPIARALRAAHGANVIHRDVKPSNIMFTKEGEPKLSDFGIAKILETNEAATLTGTGVGIGTPGYMAPEQWTGETSPQSDQYGLGVVLYELLTGRKPYEADTPAGVLIKQTSQPLPLPRQYNPEIPEAVEAALVKSLSREPAGRFADMGAFIKEFEELLTPVAATVVSAGVLKKAYTESTSGEASEMATKAVLPANKRPIGKIILIGAATLAVMAGMVWVGTQLSKGFPALADPSETPTHTESATQLILPSKTPSETPTLTLTLPPMDTPTPTITSPPPCGDINVSGFWIGKQEEVLKDYAKSLKINCGTYSNPSCDKYVSYPILLMLSQNGCDVSGQYGTGSSIYSFKPSCDIQGSITGNTIVFPLQPCLFTGVTAKLEFFSGKLVDELNGGLPVCQNQSTGTYTVTCYIHLERER
jgi:tRNA A-37 threonylcarbamoyl transferase component Bud32